MLDIVFEGPDGEPLRFPQRLMPIPGPNTAFTAPRSRGDYEMLFPFSESSLEASCMLGFGEHVEANMRKILDEIETQQNVKSSEEWKSSNTK